MLQTDRTKDPYPLTWEIPVAVLTGLLLVLLIGTQLGRGVACLLAGHGWAWPTSTQLFTSLPAVLAGNASAGLRTPVKVAAPLLWGCLVIVELLLLAAASVGASWVLRRWGPGRMKGMATAAEAEAILGLSRLRKVAPIIRPDLTGERRHG